MINLINSLDKSFRNHWILKLWNWNLLFVGIVVVKRRVNSGADWHLIGCDALQPIPLIAIDCKTTSIDWLIDWHRICLCIPIAIFSPIATDRVSPMPSSPEPTSCCSSLEKAVLQTLLSSAYSWPKEDQSVRQYMRSKAWTQVIRQSFDLKLAITDAFVHK